MTMKKLLFLLAILSTLQANAQPYSISFSGTGLSNVVAQNLTTGVIVNVPAGDVLRLSTPTGVQEVNNLKSSGLKVYPNPMTDKSTLEILPPVAGDAIITVCDMTGRVLTQFKGYIENYKQEFSLSGIKNGLQVINVQGNGYQFSEKLLSNGKSNGTAIIDQVSNNIQAVSGKKSIQNSKGVQATVDMAYNTGERLKYTAVSGNNSTVMTDIPTADKTVTFAFTECKDGDNNYYSVVQIGTQLWMAENLKTTKFKDGTTLIPNVTEDAAWAALTTPAYCWYGNFVVNKDVYGALYNWYTVNTGNLCPTGWHAPGDAEWTTLTTYLGGESVSGGKLKETGTAHWENPNTATNESGFTALPGNLRGGILKYGYWWSSTEFNSTWSWYRNIRNSNDVTQDAYNKTNGLSVRCLYGATPSVSTSNVTTIATTSATVGGNVSSEGSFPVTERGVYWGTSQNPETTGTKLQIGSGTGTFSTSLSGLNVGTTYYIRAYAKNSIGTSYGNEISFRTLVTIGDSYQGGKVAYILQPGDAGYDANVQHGLIAAPVDQSGAATWGCAGTLLSGADGTAIGTGNQNTIDIMNGCATAGIAARLCGDLVSGVYNDWYLPSKDELNKLYINKAAIGGFPASIYWSSSELDLDNAAGQYFNNGVQSISYKGNSTYGVRAVRAF
jgi:uncharacterized protein (TIGR02145 family)